MLKLLHTLHLQGCVYICTDFKHIIKSVYIEIKKKKKKVKQYKIQQLPFFKRASNAYLQSLWIVQIWIFDVPFICNGSWQTLTNHMTSVAATMEMHRFQKMRSLGNTCDFHDVHALFSYSVTRWPQSHLTTRKAVSLYLYAQLDFFTV